MQENDPALLEIYELRQTARLAVSQDELDSQAGCRALDERSPEGALDREIAEEAVRGFDDDRVSDRDIGADDFEVGGILWKVSPFCFVTAPLPAEDPFFFTDQLLRPEPHLPHWRPGEVPAARSQVQGTRRRSCPTRRHSSVGLD